MGDQLFGHCCICRAEIRPGETYYRCSVSACNMGKLKLVFCSEGCWKSHVPVARHRKAQCIEETAPT